MREISMKRRMGGRGNDSEQATIRSIMEQRPKRKIGFES